MLGAPSRRRLLDERLPAGPGARSEPLGAGARRRALPRAPRTAMASPKRYGRHAERVGRASPGRDGRTRMLRAGGRARRIGAGCESTASERGRPSAGRFQVFDWTGRNRPRLLRPALQGPVDTVTAHLIRPLFRLCWHDLGACGGAPGRQAPAAAITSRPAPLLRRGSPGAPEGRPVWELQ